MVFYFASLPSACFSVVKSIFCQYANADIKGQKVPRSKKGVSSKPPDLKGSTLKCLRGIEVSMVEKLLQSVVAGDISLHELASQCVSVKQLGKVQSAFMKGTNCTSWSVAEEKYPEFVLPEKLEVFKKLNFNKPTIPAEFMKYCQQALKKSKQPITGTETTTFTDDKIFAIDHSKTGARGVFWNTDIFDVNGTTLEIAFSRVC